jgi:hypothetical protein
VFRLSDHYSTAVPTCTDHILGVAVLLAVCPFFGPDLFRFVTSKSMYQAIKDVSASYDALVDLLESIQHFLGRLDVYTQMSLPAAIAEIIVKIMVELLSTLALVTKQINQGRPSKFDLG